MPLSKEPSPEAVQRHKLHGRQFYESIGSPKFVLAPMVDQSEFAWRLLTRSFMKPEESSKLLAYTPMFHARLFAETEKYFKQSFQPTRKVSHLDSPEESSHDGEDARTQLHLDGNPSIDRPLFVQFCANDPKILLAAAKKAAPFCDAVDLNLGCPQGIARKGRYGAFLQEDWHLISRLIGTLHKELSIPVTAKIRILDTKEQTLEYARMVLNAGASIITVHGRRRDQKGHNTGTADWTYIRYLRDNLPPETVIFANGNILQHDDIEKCLSETGADAVMSAEGNLHDPAIFASRPHDVNSAEYWRGRNGREGYRLDAVMRRYFDIVYTHVLNQSPPQRPPLFTIGHERQPQAALTSLEEGDADELEDGPARKKRKRTRGKYSEVMSQNLLSMQSHLFSLMRSVVSVRTDIRDALSKCRAGDMAAFERVLQLVEDGTSQAMMDETKEHTNESLAIAELDEDKANLMADHDGRDDHDGPKGIRERCRRPWFVCQPFLRPLPEEAFAKGSLQLSKKQKTEMAALQNAQIVGEADISHEQSVAG